MKTPVMPPIDASGRDGRGDYRSRKRLHKEALKLVHGVSSGRQWRKLKKLLRRMGRL
jgi:hypothetical protein